MNPLRRPSPKGGTGHRSSRMDGTGDDDSSDGGGRTHGGGLLGGNPSCAASCDTLAAVAAGAPSPGAIPMAVDAGAPGQGGTTSPRRASGRACIFPTQW